MSLPLYLAFTQTSPYKGVELAYNEGSLDRDKSHTQCHGG